MRDTRTHRAEAIFGFIPQALGHECEQDKETPIFREKFRLQDGGFFDRAAFGKALHVQILGVDDVGLAVHD